MTGADHVPRGCRIDREGHLNHRQEMSLIDPRRTGGVDIGDVWVERHVTGRARFQQTGPPARLFEKLSVFFLQ